MASQDPSSVTDVVLVQEGPPSTGVGILNFFPLEIRLIIYEKYFLSSNPSLDVNVGYKPETGQVVTSKITRHGNELLLAGIVFWSEAFALYWRHMTTVTASRSLRQSQVSPFSSASTSAATNQSPTEPLPVALGILVQVLPKIAKDSILHLRNIELPILPAQNQRTVVGSFALTGPSASSLVGEFKNLETVMFNEYQEGIEYNPRWNLRSRHAVMKLDIHNDFLLHPSLETPQEWMRNQYGLNVFDDPIVSKIRFLKKAIEKRRSWYDFFPGHGTVGGNDTGADLLHPLADPPPPLADAFLDFTIGKSYARPPGLPDEDGYKLVMSWEEQASELNADEADPDAEDPLEV